MISVNLELLKTGEWRATGRIDGRTGCYFEGNNQRELVAQALAGVAGAHRINGEVYDLKHVQLNPAAQAVWG